MERRRRKVWSLNAQPPVTRQLKHDILRNGDGHGAANHLEANAQEVRNSPVEPAVEKTD